MILFTFFLKPFKIKTNEINIFFQDDKFYLKKKYFANITWDRLNKPRLSSFLGLKFKVTNWALT
jgi:hypothetical protein